MDIDNSYRNILKGVSLFGGVQAFQVLLGLVRGKFVAIFLGAAGMGVSSLFNAASNTLVQFASLGLNLSLVKEAGAAQGDSGALARTVAVGRRLVLVTALLGAVLCAAGGPWLSDLTFGSRGRTGEFLLLAAAVFFSIDGAGKLSLLQGMGKRRHISLSTLCGGIAGLVFGVPLYWLWGVRGIVPAMISVSFTTWCAYSISLARTRPSVRVALDRREHWPAAKSMLAMGFVLMAGTLAGTAAGYILNLFLRHTGGLTPVGLYQAANSITNQYSGLLLSALALDYLPRLAATASDTRAMNGAVNRQGEVVSMLAAPLASVFIALAPAAVRVLLTEEFMEILPLLRWMGIGVAFQVMLYPLGYVAFARGNRKLFFWMEAVGSNLSMLLLSGGGYLLFGLEGLGYGLAADNAMWLGIYCVVNRRLYGYRPTKRLLACWGVTAVSVAAMLGAVTLLHGAWSVAAACAVGAASTAWGARGVLKMLKKDFNQPR